MARVTSPAALRTLSRASSTAAADSFLSGTSSVYVEEMYRAWKANPAR